MSKSIRLIFAFDFKKFIFATFDSGSNENHQGQDTLRRGLPFSIASTPTVRSESLVLLSISLDLEEEPLDRILHFSTISVSSVQIGQRSNFLTSVEPSAMIDRSYASGIPSTYFLRYADTSSVIDSVYFSAGILSPLYQEGGLFRITDR